MTDKKPREKKYSASFITTMALIIISLLITTAITSRHGLAEKDIPAATDAANERERIFTPIILAGEEKIRPATVAGQFYPADPQSLQKMLNGMLSIQGAGINNARAILVPHAGYIYSGAVAAASFREVKNDFNLVFLLAANHNAKADFTGVSIPDFSHYAMPGVKIPLAGIISELKKNNLFTTSAAAHENHMIEVELPFLQAIKNWPDKPDYAIVPMIANRLDEKQINELASILNTYNTPKTLFIFSVDLSHFYTDSQARDLDSSSINALMSMDSEAMSKSVTDGNHVLNTMIALARKNNWEPTSLKYSNSGDSSGDKSRVVGYSSVVFHPALSLNQHEKEEILSVARKSAEYFLENGRAPSSDMEILKKTPVLKLPRAVFVTLKKNGQLRGCIGDILSSDSLYNNIISCSIKAATSDPRFQPVTRSELDSLTLSVSILQYPQQVAAEPADFPKVLRPGIDGVIMLSRGRQSTYLPQVWEQLPEPVDFLSRLCQKQGSPAACWLDKATKLYRYGAYEFGELD